MSNLTPFETPSRDRRALARTLGGLLLATASAASLAQVGLTRLQAGDLPVTLVYPTAQAAQPQRFGPFELTVAPDAAPTPGLHRLIVMSHGTGGSTYSDHALAATLARAGFVVAQPLHQGDNYLDASRAGPDSWVTRPQEVSRVIDLLAADSAWKARLQLDKVGVHGMSAGGGTALVMAGAQWSVLGLARHCLAHADADFGFCFNGITSPDEQSKRRARYEGLRGAPEAALPATVTAVQGGRSPALAGGEVRPDPRVAAVTVAVPVSAMFSAESLARIQIPVGVVSAGRDRMLLPEFHSGHVLHDCKACSLLMDLPGAAHMDLLAPWPEGVARSEAARQPAGGAPEPGFDGAQRDQAFARIAAFFDRQLGR